ncbi:MAG: hypothetical protein HQL64_11255, partial [Magnetococcales bacterium]|nr:hypothetical protein [Magnetococcales bacterium]
HTPEPKQPSHTPEPKQPSHTPEPTPEPTHAPAIDGTQGNDHLTGGKGDDVFVDHAGNDAMKGGAGNDLFVFGPTSSGHDSVDGGHGGGWTDAINVDQAVHAGPGVGDWTLVVDGHAVTDVHDHGVVTLNDASGTITLSDHSEAIAFHNIERIEW